MPRLTERDTAFSPIVDRAAQLVCTTPEFDDLAREVGLGSHGNGATDPAERARLRAELDGMVAHLYGLTEEEFTHILGTFPLVPQPTKDAALAAYRELAPDPDDEQLARLIAQGESARLEFKVAARWNPYKNASDDSMRDNIVQEVAAFMNSKEGGAIVIGVEDNGTVRGLADDIRVADKNKPNRDGYELWLRNTLTSYLGADNVAHCVVTFHQIEGKEVCRIQVPPAGKPVYVNGELYIRSGNQKRKLSAQEAFAYITERWG